MHGRITLLVYLFFLSSALLLFFFVFPGRGGVKWHFSRTRACVGGLFVSRLISEEGTRLDPTGAEKMEIEFRKIYKIRLRKYYPSFWIYSL